MRLFREHDQGTGKGIAFQDGCIRIEKSKINGNPGELVKEINACKL